jgi:hypothetical protein
MTLIGNDLMNGILLILIGALIILSIAIFSFLMGQHKINKYFDEIPCISTICPKFKNDLAWFNTSWNIDEHGFCPNNLTMREIICDCAKTDSDYYKKHHAFCMAYCFRCE